MIDSVIIALDFNKKEDALRVVDELEGLVDFFKVGLELFISEGPEIIKILKKRDKKVFLDLKLHDIPNTVYKTTKAVLQYQVDMLTIHTTGGFEMMKYAVDALREFNTDTKIIGVTILTSLDEEKLRKILNFPVDLNSLVVNLALEAKKAGINGVVSSAQEVSSIKKNCGDDFLVITPGIRFEKESFNDQKRLANAQSAFSYGADYIVLGRAITSKSNLRKVLQEMFA